MNLCNVGPYDLSFLRNGSSEMSNLQIFLCSSPEDAPLPNTFREDSFDYYVNSPPGCILVGCLITLISSPHFHNGCGK